MNWVLILMEEGLFIAVKHERTYIYIYIYIYIERERERERKREREKVSFINNF